MTIQPAQFRGAEAARRVLITGGGTGIGRALALAMAARGDRVMVCGRRAQTLKALRDVEPTIDVVDCDVTRNEDRNRLTDRVRTGFGGLDVLVNNAGTQHTQSYGTGALQAEDVEAEVRINLIAPMLLVDALLPLMGGGEHPSIIVNMVSLLAVTPKASAPGYCASKAGLLSFTRALRLQLAGRPIKVVEVFPPLVDTPMTAGRGSGKMSAERFASDLLHALDAERATIAVGDAARMLRLARWFPALADRAMRRMIRPSLAAATVP